ncbi:hypothetical protein [Allosphingosinicella vermicomposti]|uniref:hypothetical protein n=1 Tax=Allosphingosinicella vermicomposti TaxID=614671 RepID=UPI000D1058C0|nr:hypothetical protein [Allosphingosinicella vermicomposti]
MRYSLQGSIGIEALREGFERILSHLVAAEVDRVSGFNVYLTAWHQGSRVAFIDSDGEPTDEVKIGTVVRRTVPKMLATENAKHLAVDTTLQKFAANLFWFWDRWKLDVRELTSLLHSDPVRLERIISGWEVKLLKRERDRLSSLLLLDVAIRERFPDRHPSELIREPGFFEGSSGETLLDHLAAGGAHAIYKFYRRLADT